MRATGAAAALVLAFTLLGRVDAARAAAPLADVPIVWYEDDRRPISEPAERDPNLYWDSINDALFSPIRRGTDPGRLTRRIGSWFGSGEIVGPATNVNVLDEAPNSTWFTNRIGLFPMSIADAVRGPGSGQGPDRGGPWTIISAKTQGVTPGFIIRDTAGGVYLIKFDPPGYLGIMSVAGVLAGRIFHAAGYNVPDDAVVRFAREDLVLGEGLMLKGANGKKRPATVADLDELLAAVDRLPDGRYMAISSKFVDGTPIGPFDYLGRRKDDPNDRIPHEDRRELRGLRLLAAWLNHFDTKQGNSLDAFVETEAGQGYVLHYLIDFASCLGTGANGPVPRYGYEYTLDPKDLFKRALGLGLYEDPWRRLQRPEGLNEVGYWQSEIFNPPAFNPLQPNSAFVNMTRRDAYWAAKIISAFSDAHLQAISDAAGYRDPAAAAYVARILAERRDKIARYAFDRAAPLDFFHYEGGALAFRDLGAERGIYGAGTSRYRARPALVNADRQATVRGAWQVLRGVGAYLGDWPEIQAAVGGDGQFLELELQVDRGRGWSGSLRVYVAPGSGRVVAVER